MIKGYNAAHVPIVEHEYTHPGGLLKFARIRVGDVHGVCVRYQPKDGGELWFELERAEWQRIVEAMREPAPVPQASTAIPCGVDLVTWDGE